MPIWFMPWLLLSTGFWYIGACALLQVMPSWTGFILAPYGLAAISAIVGVLVGLPIRWFRPAPKNTPLFRRSPSKSRPFDFVRGQASHGFDFLRPSAKPASSKGVPKMADTPQVRFEKIFGPKSQDRPGLPRPLRNDVYVRMRVAMSVTDGRRLRPVKTHWLKTFHSDTRDPMFSEQEALAVFNTIPHIFDGEKLA